MRNLTQKKKVKTYKPTIHLSMYNLINKPILSTMMIAFCLSLISLGSMSRERGRRGEGGVGGGGLGSEARMKRKDEKRKSLPPWHSGAATISQTGRGTKRLQAIFGLSLQSKYKKKKQKSFCSLSEDSEPVCTSFTVSLFLESLGFSTSVGIKRSCSSWTRT